MQSKNYNAYRITHKDGSIEDINAVDLIQALENMDVQETESKVIQAFLVKENVRTLVAGEPTEILFNIVTEGGVGSIATPMTGRIHVGDQIQLKAIPERNYEFVAWKLNGETISTEQTFLLTMPELASGLDTAVFTAVFTLADVSWTSKVMPEEAGGTGCMSFPLSGKSKAKSEIQLLAVEADGYEFDHWERNSKQITTSNILVTEASPLAEGETEAVYTAVFRTI